MFVTYVGPKLVPTLVSLYVPLMASSYEMRPGAEKCRNEVTGPLAVYNLKLTTIMTVTHASNMTIYRSYAIMAVTTIWGVEYLCITEKKYIVH